MLSHLGAKVAILSMHLICYIYWRIRSRASTQAKALASWFLRSISALWARTWKTLRTALYFCRQTRMSLHIFWSHKGLFMIIYTLASHCLSLLEQPNCQWRGLSARDHKYQPNHSELSPLAAMVHSISRNLYRMHEQDLPQLPLYRPQGLLQA